MPIIERKGIHAIFQKKGEKRATKGQNIWKFGQKCTKFENILKKGSLMCLTITCKKQLEYALLKETLLHWWLFQCLKTSKTDVLAKCLRYKKKFLSNSLKGFHYEQAGQNWANYHLFNFVTIQNVMVNIMEWNLYEIFIPSNNHIFAAVNV